MATVFVMPDEDFDTTTDDGRRRTREAVLAATQKLDIYQRPSGGAKGGVGRGRIVHNDTIYRIK